VGKELAVDWYEAIINQNKIVLWVFLTEGIRPTRLPSSWRSSMDSNLNNEMKLWREERKESWPEFLTHGPYRFAKKGIEHAVENGNDLKVPSENQTLRFFGKIVATAPIAGFEWANYCLDVIEDMPDNLISKLSPDFYLIVLTFEVIESRAQYWRNKIGYQNISELELPEWASNALEMMPGKRGK
jgi:hypothetical protein